MPMASRTCWNQVGSMVAEEPMKGIIFPPFWVFTSLRYVPAEPRASVRMTSGFDFSMAATSVRYEEAPSLIGWLIAILPPSLVNAFVAGSTKAWEPMSSPNTSAAFLYGAWLGPYRSEERRVGKECGQWR